MLVRPGPIGTRKGGYPEESSMRPVTVAAVVLVLAGLGVAVERYRTSSSPNQRETEPPPPVPVVTAPVQQQDVPLILTGIGTVQALNSAVIRSQVTGILERVNFVQAMMANGLVPAVGHALGIIPAAHMDADSHIGQSVYDRVVDCIDVELTELVGIVAPGAYNFHVFWIANHGQRHFVFCT